MTQYRPVITNSVSDAYIEGQLYDDLGRALERARTMAFIRNDTQIAYGMKPCWSGYVVDTNNKFYDIPPKD